MDILRQTLAVLLALVVLTFFLLIVVGCLGVSPEEARRRALGGDYDDGDEEHNPGLPCLACHDRDFHPGDDVFATAGTVYFDPSDADANGLPGVTVHVRDARGREMHAITNDAGNFMFEVEDEDGARVRVRDDGKTELSFWPAYPLEVWIEQGGLEQRMQTPIRREGSCATCHSGEASATSVGRVYLRETP